MFEPNESSRSPQFAVQRTGWLAQFFSSLEVLVREPAPPKKFVGGPYFRDCWIDQRFPKRAFTVAVSLQIVLILFPPPIWSIRPPLVMNKSNLEVTWYGPIHDFPVLLPRSINSKSAPRIVAAKMKLPLGADAFHPRQTILTTPMHPTHPRQVLIQPSSVQEPPKILPSLPNIVQLAAAQPARPIMELTAMKPKTPSHLSAPDAAAPDISTPEKREGAISIASSTHAPPKPVLPVSPMAAPRVAANRADASIAAPEIAERTPNANTIIAFSATPAQVPQPPTMPAGNLSSRVSISPDGMQSGTISENSAGNGSGVGSHGPDRIFIGVGIKAGASPTAGLGIAPGSRGMGNPLPSRPIPRARIAAEDSTAHPLSPGSVKDISKLDVPPEKVLGAKQVYTLHVNMPNLTSASGSWVLNFAELNEEDAAPYSKVSRAELAGPVPFRKVDPKYPPELRSLHVEGEVVLYAIIRKDGSVDSIQLVHSVDPRLDANAMEALTQWKFHPAVKNGEPLDLEAVVHIPFKSRTTAF